jgi:hypothetical protein
MSHQLSQALIELLYTFDTYCGMHCMRIILTLLSGYRRRSEEVVFHQQSSQERTLPARALYVLALLFFLLQSQFCI